MEKKRQFRFYNIGGYIEITASSLEEAKGKSYDKEKGVHNPIVVSENGKFVYAYGIGEPVEINERGREIDENGKEKY